MRNFIPVIYREVSYALDEDGYNGAESDDIVRKRFVKAWNILMNDYTVNHLQTLLELKVDLNFP